MNWIYASSKFRYNGEPVERRRAACDTPFGQLQVFEAVGGRAMMQYFYIGFRRDSNGSIVPSLSTARIPCHSLETGVLLQEVKWKELTDKMINCYETTTNTPR